MTKPAHITQACYDAAVAYIPIASETAHIPEGAEAYHDDLCAGALFGPDGKVVVKSLGHVCHSWLRHGVGKKQMEECVFVGAMPSRCFVKKDEEANRAFLAWMKDKSPFRNFILNDDVNDMYEGAYLIDGICGPDNMMYLVKAFRMTIEDVHRIPFWYEMVKRGVHPMLAFLTANVVDENNGRGGSTHNTVMYEPKDKKELRKIFVDHVPSDKGDWTSTAVFNMVQADWGARDSVLPLDRGGVKTEKVPDGWGGYTTRSIKVSVDTIAEDLVKLQKEVMK
jgi:hypothetical protein